MRPSQSLISRTRLAFEWLLILLLAISAILVTAFSNPGRQLSAWLFDRAIGWTVAETDPRILIVTIDESSLTEIGPWPWPREVHARLIDRLREGGAAMVGYDVLFVEPGPEAGDAALAAALARSGRVAIPAYASRPGANGRNFDLQLPIAPLREAARAVGHVNVVFDPDGQMRRGGASLGSGPGALPHLTVALAQAIDPAIAIPPDEVIIPYRPAGSWPIIPAASLLRGEVPRAVLKDRIALVGASAQGLGDILPVPAPAGSVMPGIEVQANLLDALLNRTAIDDRSIVPSALGGTLLLVLLMAGFWRTGPDRTLTLTLALGLTATAATAAALWLTQVWITPLPLLAGLALAYPLWSWRRLTALNRFVEHEARALDGELGETRGGGGGLFGKDTIAATAASLRGLIGELRDRRRFLHSVIESAPDAICVIGTNGKVSVANRQAEVLFGADAEGQETSALLERLAPGCDPTKSEIETADGRMLLIKEAQLAASGTAAGDRILRLVDITERRATEREREQFLEFLSHDLRAPAARIVAALEQTGPDRPAPLDRIAGHARTALKLADDFVQLARLSAIKPQIEPHDLQGLVEEAIDNVWEAARDREVKVTLAAPDAMPPVATDPALLIRALGNLIGNAIAYSPVGGEVSCTLAQAGSAVTCAIADRGPGIPAERKAALFEHFGPNDPARKYSAGLGLSFVRRAIDLTGGQIACETGPAGTEFVLILPIFSENAGPQAPG